MVFCSNCGADIEETQKFCPECGTRNEKAFAATTPEPPEVPVDDMTPPPPPKPRDTPPPPPPREERRGAPPKRGILDRIDVDQEDIDEVAEKAKKGLGILGNLARKGLKRGAELASQGIEVAKDSYEERVAASKRKSEYVPAPVEDGIFCPNCGGQVSGPGKFCNHCGHKLE